MTSPNQIANRNTTARHILYSLCLMALAWVLYSPSIHNEFVYDDIPIVQNNPGVRSTQTLKTLWSRDYYRVSGERTWRPLSTASLVVDYALWRREDAVGYHVTNIALHGAASIAVYALAASLMSPPAALVAAAVFAAHPLASESVNPVSFREDLMSALFFIAALAVYVSARKKRGIGLDSGMALVLLFAAGVLSKENALALPVAFLLYEFLFPKLDDEPRKGGGILLWVCLAAVAAGYLVFRFVLLHNAAGDNPYPAPPGPMAATMSTVFLRYIGMFFAPLRLCLDYAVVPLSARSAAGAGAIAAAVGSVAAAVALRRRAPLPAFGFLLFVLCFLPVSNIVPFGAWMADRYMYLPVMGLTLMIVGAADGLAVFIALRSPRWGAVPFLVLAVWFGGLAILTSHRNPVWRDPYSLWKNTTRCCPSSSRALAGYGRELFQRGEHRDAERRLKEALRIDPKHAEARMTLGSVYIVTGRLADAETAFREALRVAPRSGHAYYNLGLVYAKQKRPEEAVRNFRKALELVPGWRDPLSQLGLIHMRAGRYELARRYYARLVRLYPGDASGRTALGACLMSQGKNDEAEKQLREALKIDPNSDLARFFLARMNRLPHAGIHKMK